MTNFKTINTCNIILISSRAWLFDAAGAARISDGDEMQSRETIEKGQSASTFKEISLFLVNLKKF